MIDNEEYERRLQIIRASQSGMVKFGESMFDDKGPAAVIPEPEVLLGTEDDGSPLPVKRCAMIDERHGAFENGSHVWKDGSGQRYTCPGPVAE